MSLSVGVIVCAYTSDRFEDIVRSIESLHAQVPVPDEIVLVIDHNDGLLTRTRRQWPGLTVIASTGTPGLSGARNTGIGNCRSDVVAFLDDDARARPGWLRHLSEAYADPAVVAIGGRAVPSWPSRAPTTLPPELWWVVGCTYEGQPTQTTDVRNVMGCSMSFRRSALNGTGGFVEGIGRGTALPLGCEETELCIRLRQRDPGARIVFEPRAVVDHRVGAVRTTWSYLVRRSYAEGLSKAAISRLVGSDSALSAERVYTRSVLPRGIARELRCGRPESALAILTSLTCAVGGYLRERLKSVAAPGASAQPHDWLEPAA